LQSGTSVLTSHIARSGGSNFSHLVIRWFLSSRTAGSTAVELWANNALPGGGRHSGVGTVCVHAFVGENSMKDKPWQCRLGIHKFVVAWNDDNQRYQRCRRCGKDLPGSRSGPLDRFTDIGGA
jgi:hypothetical protein